MTTPVPRARVERPKTLIRTAEDVTEEIRDLATRINDEWFEGAMKWDAFWDRLDGSILGDGSELDLGDQYGTDAMKKIKKHVRHIRSSEY